MTIDQKELREMVQTLDQAERQRPASKILTDLNEKTDQCACGYQAAPSKFQVLNTGAMQCLNNVCRDCKEGEKDDRERARIVCVGCRKVVQRLDPMKDRDGFRFEANRTYHIEKCPVCCPGTQSSNIVEKIIFLRKQNTKR